MKKRFKALVFVAALSMFAAVSAARSFVPVVATGTISTYGPLAFYVKDSAVTMVDSSGIISTNVDGTSSLGFANVGSYTTEQEGTEKAQKVLDSLGLYAGTYVAGYTSVYGLIQGRPQISFRAKGLYEAVKAEQTFNEVYLPEMQAYVTDGMSKKQALDGAGKYLASKLSYNYNTSAFLEALYVGASLTTAWTGTHDPLGDGSGVCHDYAIAFCALTREIPFTNGVVDWTNGTKAVLDTKFVSNGTNHAWNMVTYDGVTHYYDITWYDTGGNSKWLDMGAVAQADPTHTVKLIKY